VKTGCSGNGVMKGNKKAQQLSLFFIFSAFSAPLREKNTF